MGKGSSLRQPAKEPEHLNGKGNGRKLVDLDEMPEGCDSDIWHLTLYFVQKCEEYGVKASQTNGRPVVYETLKNCLTRANPSAIRGRARTDGIAVRWLTIVELSIDLYFDDGYYPKSYVVDVFTDKDTFDAYIDAAIASLVLKEVVTTGTAIPQQDSEVLPSKRTAEQQERHEILSRKYTEDEQQEKMREFRSRG